MFQKCLNKDLKIALLGCGVILGGLYYFISKDNIGKYYYNDEDDEEEDD